MMEKTTSRSLQPESVIIPPNDLLGLIVHQEAFFDFIKTASKKRVPTLAVSAKIANFAPNNKTQQCTLYIYWQEPS